MKEMYKRRDETHLPGRRGRRSEAVRKRRRTVTSYVRRRRLLGAALILGFVLLAMLVAGYLLSEGETLRGDQSSAVSEEPEQEQPVASDEEAATGEQAAASRPTVLLGEYFTDYAWDPDEGRQANLKMASGAIDETILEPGEEFSALEALQGLDYQPAKVFANGGVDYEVGGGLCQVSSTLFMAANYAGLEITDRNPHYAELPYIRPGFDATVWFGENGWGALDMKFRNNTDGDILIREFVNEDGFLVAEIYGEEPADKTVSMSSEKVEEDLGKGITWATYKEVTDENGETLEDGLLYETVYSYNPPVPEELKHETNEPRGSGWLDLSNTTNWNDKR
ncbi:MAG TPA: VanW family protein [Rubrobacteraceae bacterium]|jgi:vancomycin resistance protein YoaR|nr:VanW family protein [Rubrobacteraceae bacterium]